MRLDEVDRDVGKRSTVVDALPRTRLGHFQARHFQPVGVHSLLLLERPVERSEDRTHAERADGRAAYAVHGRREDGVDQLLRRAAIRAVNDLAGRLCGGSMCLANTQQQ